MNQAKITLALIFTKFTDPKTDWYALSFSDTQKIKPFWKINQEENRQDNNCLNHSVLFYSVSTDSAKKTISSLLVMEQTKSEENYLPTNHVPF